MFKPFPVPHPSCMRPVPRPPPALHSTPRRPGLVESMHPCARGPVPWPSHRPHCVTEPASACSHTGTGTAPVLRPMPQLPMPQLRQAQLHPWTLRCLVSRCSLRPRPPPPCYRSPASSHHPLPNPRPPICSSPFPSSVHFPLPSPTTVRSYPGTRSKPLFLPPPPDPPSVHGA